MLERGGLGTWDRGIKSEKDFECSRQQGSAPTLAINQDQPVFRLQVIEGNLLLGKVVQTKQKP